MEVSDINNSLDVNTFKRISSTEKNLREPPPVVDDALLREIIDRGNYINLQTDGFENEEIVDKPKTFIREFLMEEKLRIKSLQMKGVKYSSVAVVKKTRSQKGKCYTCYPRKKILEHIIQNENGITFHHDLCTRNMIIVTPNKHYSTLADIPPEEIGIIFREIDSFCTGWNITDYNVNYNQGEWQTHKHFHLKIKTYDHLVKRMKGDHFKMVALERLYKGL
jgi:hypothetical protein